MNAKKNSPLLFVIIALSLIICIVSSVLVIINTDKTDTVTDLSITVIDSGMINSSSDNFYGEIISADLNGENPYIEVEWFNNTDTGYTAVEEFYIYRVNDKLVDCRKNPDEYAWNDIAYVFSSYGSIRMKYYVGDMDIEADSTYLLQTEIFMDSATSLKSTLWLEFRTGELTDETKIIN